MMAHIVEMAKRINFMKKTGGIPEDTVPPE